MANTIPCPNPTCTHLFTLAELQSAPQLLCPKCGFRMQGKGTGKVTPPTPNGGSPAAKPIGAPAAKNAPPPAAMPITVPNIPSKAPPKAMPITVPAVLPATPKAAPSSAPAAPAKPATPAVAPAAQPVAKPVANPPMATPITAAAPVAVAVVVPEPVTPATGEASQSDGTYFNPDVAAPGPLVRPNVTRRSWNWMRLLITFFAVGFAVCVVVIGFGLLVWFLPGMQGFRDMLGAGGDQFVGKIRNSKGDHEKVYRLVLPRKEWTSDADIEGRLGAETAWQNNQYKHPVWFALVVKDYGMHKPRDAELLRTAIERLESHFGEDMELGAKAEPVTVPGAEVSGGREQLAGQKLRFRGLVKDSKWEGDCYMFFKSGVAYWLFLASPDIDIVDFFGAELPDKHLFVVSERRGWREQPIPTITYTSIDAKVNVTAPEKVWTKAADPKSDDDNGILLLVGRRDKDNQKTAHVLVFTTKKEDDLKTSIKSIRDAVEAKEKSADENYKIVLADEASKADLGVETKIGAMQGRLVELKKMHGDEPQPHRYYVLAVVQDADVCYGILADCDWRSRAIWRQEFLDMLRTFRVK